MLAKCKVVNPLNLKKEKKQDKTSKFQKVKQEKRLKTNIGIRCNVGIDFDSLF